MELCFSNLLVTVIFSLSAKIGIPFKISHVYLGNLRYVNGKKLNGSVLTELIDNHIHNNKFKMNKGNNYTYTNE